MRTSAIRNWTAGLWAAGMLWACAGGSGLNVVVVVNQASSNSVALGNYYAEKRQVPPENLIRIHWAGTNTQWSLADFTNTLANPLMSTLTERGLIPQIDYVLLSMDIPYRITQTGGVGVGGANGTTAALFYGFKADSAPPPGLPNSCSLPVETVSSYAGSEAPLRGAPPDTASALPFLAMMLTQSNLDLCQRVVDRGVASDGTFPTNQILLGKSTDGFRNIRYLSFDHAVFDARVAGAPRLVRTNLDYPTQQSGLLGYQNGWAWFKVATNLFAPGAMADHLTSYGGLLFEYAPWQTNILNWLTSGATASYGTVVEPCAYLEKFPSPQNFFYQGRGFNLAESYYLSLTNPYQGILVGEPLAAPFAQSATGEWSGLPQESLLSGTTQLTLLFAAADAQRPLQQVDLFLDGKFLNTLTSYPPAPGNELHVQINSQALTYVVPAGATLATVAAGLAAELNQPSHLNGTQVEAIPHGDRLELRSLEGGRPGDQVNLTVSNDLGNAAQLTTFIRAGDHHFLDTTAYGLRTFGVSNAPAPPTRLHLSVTQTNGNRVEVAVTNVAGGSNLQLVQKLVAAINANPALSNATDGLVAEDVVDYSSEGSPYTEFNLRANSLGWDAARMEVNLTATSPLLVSPSAPQQLDAYLSNLQPRNHLYLSAGLTHLPLTFSFDTTPHANGFHELTAVAYEGSHVRTQTRLPVSVVISNSPLAATFTTLLGGVHTALEATLQFQVAANTPNVSRIELYSTGGVVAVASNTSTATLSVAATDLGVGWHPFYALVTTTDDDRYRTETRGYRIIDAEPPMRVGVALPPLELQWLATAGRSYRVRGSAHVSGPYEVRQTVTPTNSLGSWVETQPETTQFYRVEMVP